MENLEGKGQVFKQARLKYLDFYKGICILFVICTHYVWTKQQRMFLLFPFWIDMAVPVFMVITGYVSALSFQKRGFSLRMAYHPKEIMCKWLRFIIPFFPVFVLQLVVCIFVAGESMSLEGIAKLFLVGGGPGAYYFPVMIQVVLIIPVICQVIKKMRIKGLLICFIVNVSFEIGKTLIDINPGIYRICSLRYFFILAYGCYLQITENDEHYERKRKWYYVVGFIGIIYIIIFEYTQAEPIITNQWTKTSVFAVLFIVPVMLNLMKFKGFHNRVVELLGKASFNIFLVQMLYYWAFAGRVYELIPNIIARLVINIFICCLLGSAFYMIESPITQKLVRSVKVWTEKSV